MADEVFFFLEIIALELLWNGHENSNVDGKWIKSHENIAKSKIAPQVANQIVVEAPGFDLRLTLD